MCPAGVQDDSLSKRLTYPQYKSHHFTALSQSRTSFNPPSSIFSFFDRQQNSRFIPSRHPTLNSQYIPNASLDQTHAVPDSLCASSMDKANDLKRPVVLNMGQIQKYPTRRDVFAMTLPFRQLDSWPSHVAKVIKQTRNRWTWFINARALDDKLSTRLGTLSYLPREIRQKIYQEHLDSYFCPCKDCARAGTSCRGWFWEYVHGTREDTDIDSSVFELKSYDIYCPEPDEESGEGFDRVEGPNVAPLSHIRLSSPTIKAEFEHFFLSERIFQFACPYVIPPFLDQLSEVQQSQLQHVALNFAIDPCCTLADSRKGWMANCSLLPSTLKTVVFRVRFFPLDVTAPDLDRVTNLDKRVRYAKHLAPLVEVVQHHILRRIPAVKIFWQGYADERLGPDIWDILEAATNI